jgi:HD-GYP domain-containing protein (c-di-GMP phosphodiesterase class II)
MLLLVNTVAVSIIVGLQSGLSPLNVWRESIQFGSAEELALLALGLLGAVVVDVHTWALLILLLPAIVVYRSLERYIQLRQQTLDAVEALADIVDLRDPYTANHSRRVALYARDLATALGLEPDEVDLIERVARVHDVGKVIVDLEVLAKEGGPSSSNIR